jgi:hypothetical protein
VFLRWQCPEKDNPVHKLTSSNFIAQKQKDNTLQKKIAQIAQKSDNGKEGIFRRKTLMLI